VARCPGSVRAVIVKRFHALIAVIANTSWASSSSSKDARALSRQAVEHVQPLRALTGGARVLQTSSAHSARRSRECRA